MKTFALAASAAYLLAQTQAAQFVMYTGTTADDGDDNLVERADPILAPGVLSQHVHQVFGANGFSPAMSYESLQKSTCTTVGSAGGMQNIADKSNYWHPALFMEANDGSGFIRIPTLGHKFYYKDAGTGTKRQPFEFPQGFRMLAGNPFMREAAADAQQQNITQWICHDSTGSNQGTDGGFPTGVKDCDQYPGFNGAIHFPHCWNGDDFNPADPTAHVVYPTGDIENGECPSSHPTRLPHIFAENQFNLHAYVDKVKPDTFTLAMGDPTGYGWHFDFFNGWDDGAIPELIDTCPQGQYGNQDIGGCPSFKTNNQKTDTCALKLSYKENVDSPGQYLPGCNPVQTQNPAVYYETAPLGVSSNQCKVAAGGPGGGSQPPPASSMEAPAASSSVVPVDSEPASSAAPTLPSESSTLMTTTKPTHTTKTPPSYPSPGSNPSKISCPDSDRQPFTLNGKTFRIQCGIDHRGGDMKAVTAHSLGECVEACANTDGCVDVSLSGVACYMKSTLGERYKNSGVNGARLVTAVGGSKPQAYATAYVTETVTPGRHRRHLEKHLHRFAS